MLWKGQHLHLHIIKIDQYNKLLKNLKCLYFKFSELNKICKNENKIRIGIKKRCEFVEKNISGFFLSPTFNKMNLLNFRYLYFSLFIKLKKLN